MRTLVKKFLDQDLSRRDFGRAMVAMGFSGAAIDSVLSSVAYAAPTPPIEGFEFTGSGGEILAECFKAAGIEYIFDVNSTGQTPFYDALSTRPELKMIVALQEGQATAMAQGYELASGKTPALFIPSIGTPNALSNLYNAWKDRSAIAVFSDGSSFLTEGRDGFQQVDDWLAPTEQFTKWRWQLKNPDRIGEICAFRLMCSALEMSPRPFILNRLSKCRCRWNPSRISLRRPPDCWWKPKIR